MAVVGGGIVGLAVARELIRRRPGTRVLVLEKEDRVAAHQTGHNSGVVHAGIYYRPGSLKAELCARGRELLRDYCLEHDLPYDECGKLVVAVDPDELGRFDALERTAAENGVPGLRRIGPEEIAEIEPHATGLAALHSPRTAITDFVAIAEQLARDVEAAGGVVLLSTTVTRVFRSGRGSRLQVVTAPGWTSSTTSCCAPGSRPTAWADWSTGSGSRGSCRSAASTSRCPGRSASWCAAWSTRCPIRATRSSACTSPAASTAASRSARTRCSRSTGRGTAPAPACGSPTRPPPSPIPASGGWRGPTGAPARARSAARCRRGPTSAPPSGTCREIGPGDVVRAGAGVRAQAVARDGALLDDFAIVTGDAVTSVRNAPSPAATSSLAIAEHIVTGLPG